MTTASRHSSWHNQRLYTACEPDMRAQCTASKMDGKVEGRCRSTFIMCGRDDMAVPSTTSITTRPCRLAMSCTLNRQLGGQDFVDINTGTFTQVLQVTQKPMGLCPTQNHELQWPASAHSNPAVQKLRDAACRNCDIIYMVSVDAVCKSPFTLLDACDTLMHGRQ